MKVYPNDVLFSDLKLEFINPEPTRGFVESYYNSISLKPSYITNHEVVLGFLKGFELILMLLLVTIVVTSLLKAFFQRLNINTVIPNLLSGFGSCLLILMTYNISNLTNSITFGMSSLSFLCVLYMFALILTATIVAHKLSNDNNSEASNNSKDESHKENNEDEELDKEIDEDTDEELEKGNENEVDQEEEN